MNNAKMLHTHRLFSSLKIAVTSFLVLGLLVFANLAIAQSSSHNGGQWRSVGGKMVASGEGHFSNKWSRSTRYFHGDGKYWKNNEPTSNKITHKKIPATHTLAEVTKDVWIRKGQITVRGPGYLGLFIRSKGAGAVLKFPESGKVFHTQGLGKDEWLHDAKNNWKWYPGEVVNIDPSQTLGGWVPAGRTMTLDVWVYNPISDWGVWGSGYNAPASVEYEFWFFPRKGGKVIKVAETPGKAVVDSVDDLPPGAVGYVKSIKGSKDGKLINKEKGRTLQKGDFIYKGDILETHDVTVTMSFYPPNGPLCVIDRNTKIKITGRKVSTKKGGIYNFLVKFGRILFSGNSGSFRNGYKVETLNSVIGWEGTIFETAYNPNTGQTAVSVFEGTVRLDCTRGKAAPIMVNAGMKATLDGNCNHTLSILAPDKNTPAKAGWDVGAKSNDTGTQPPHAQSGVTGGGTGSGGGPAQGTARLLTAKSNRDMVGRNETFRGNGKTDAIFRAQFSAPNRTVTAVEVRNTSGLRSVWDTRPNNRLWLGGVVIGGRTMNRPDGSVSFRLGSGQNTLDFFVEDNGSIRGGKTNYRMTIFFASGAPLIMDITPGPVGQPGGGTLNGTPGGIRIEFATYGANCGVAKGNVTAHIAKQCNGKSRCRYVVNHKIIGDPAYGCAKIYTVRYRCGNNPRVFDRSLPAEAGWGDKAVLLECSGSQN